MAKNELVNRKTGKTVKFGDKSYEKAKAKTSLWATPSEAKKSEGS